MPGTVVVAASERAVLGYALRRAISFYTKGTAEQRESAASLAQMLSGLESAPPGAVEVDFLTEDAYLLGIRLFYISVELEEYCLAAREGRLGEDEETANPALAEAVARYFPELSYDPTHGRFDAVRGVFTDLGIKLDTAVTEVAPRARGMYNHDREVISDKAIAIREERVRRRAAEAEVQQAAAAADAAVAVAERENLSDLGWGVEFSTGLAPDDIAADSFRVLSVGSVRIFLTNYGGRLAAVDATCSHQHASLVKGRFEGTSVECPRHGAVFDFRTGTELCPPFCPRWMEHHGLIGRLIEIATPDKHGGDLLRYPLRVANGEIVLRV